MSVNLIERQFPASLPIPAALPVENVAAIWTRVKLARHSERPRTLDYITRLCSHFVELHGDRRWGDDAALVGGLARFAGRNVVVIGQQKGRDTKENIKRNFGMPNPEGYRKALRLFQLAEKFGHPLLCFIDTPGAYPGLESEERGIAQAIAENLYVLADLKVPVIATIIGEGGSGGALAIGLADRVLMLENSIYSVASPEASASILWRDSALAPEAAHAMKITAPQVYQLGIVDEIVPEPAGGAHTSLSQSASLLQAVLVRHLEELEREFQMAGSPGGTGPMLEKRYQKFRQMGVWQAGG